MVPLSLVIVVLLLFVPFTSVIVEVCLSSFQSPPFCGVSLKPVCESLLPLVEVVEVNLLMSLFWFSVYNLINGSYFSVVRINQA